MSPDHEGDPLLFRFFRMVRRNQGRMVACGRQWVASVHRIDQEIVFRRSKARKRGDVLQDTCQRIRFVRSELGRESGEAVRNADVPILFDLVQETVARSVALSTRNFVNYTDNYVDDALLPRIKPSGEPSRLAPHPLPDGWTVSIPREHICVIGKPFPVLGVPEGTHAVFMIRVGERIVQRMTLSSSESS